jgi:hypothetical protein
MGIFWIKKVEEIYEFKINDKLGGKFRNEKTWIKVCRIKIWWKNWEEFFNKEKLVQKRIMKESRNKTR